MTIKNIVLTAAGFLGREDIIGYLEGRVTDNDEISALSGESQILVRCANLVINRLATEYIPIKTVENVNSVNGKITYASLLENVMDVIKVYDYHENPVSYKLYPLYIKTRPDAVKVEYTFVPRKYKIDEKIAYEERVVPERVIAYGVAAESCMIDGNYDEGRLWDKRFKESVKNLSVPKKCVLKARSWI